MGIELFRIDIKTDEMSGKELACTYVDNDSVIEDKLHVLLCWMPHVLLDSSHRDFLIINLMLHHDLICKRIGWINRGYDG